MAVDFEMGGVLMRYTRACVRVCVINSYITFFLFRLILICLHFLDERLSLATLNISVYYSTFSRRVL